MQKVEEQPVPPKPSIRKKLAAYYEENKDVILADYSAMKLTPFFAKWRINSKVWGELKEKWAVANKGRSIGKRAHDNDWVKTGKHGPQGRGLTEHEQYLVLLGYQQAVREFLNNRGPDGVMPNR